MTKCINCGEIELKSKGIDEELDQEILECPKCKRQAVLDVCECCGHEEIGWLFKIRIEREKL